MAVWFSASAVVPALSVEWRLSGAESAWLTMSVQAGFVAGTLMSALLNLADRLPSRGMFAASASLAALSTLLIPILCQSVGPALVLRFATGFFLAGVYPVGMRIMATWTREDRGFGIGLLVGALTVGSAAPHLLRSLVAARDWRSVLVGAALLAFGGGIVALFIQEGPYRTPAPRFDWRYAARLLRQRDVLLANLGYLGHMWELYAMWAWLPLFLLAEFPVHGSTIAFLSIAAGGAGSLVAGRLADRFGRTLVTSAAMVVSGACALSVGLLMGNALPLVAVCLLWGFSVVADSAQFSACVSELCVPEYIGTALTLQTCLGFILTMVTIRMLPHVQALVGWRWAFALLAAGPALGTWAMLALRLRPEARKLDGGRG